MKCAIRAGSGMSQHGSPVLRDPEQPSRSRDVAACDGGSVIQPPVSEGNQAEQGWRG